MNDSIKSFPSKDEPMIVYGAGYILSLQNLFLKDGVSMADFAKAFPFFTTTGWALFCVNIEGKCDGFGYRFIDYQIKAKIGNYLKEWSSFSFITQAEYPEIPDWIDAEFNPATRCLHIYGPGTATGDNDEHV